jgi:amidophosphoribosyltransferase
MEKTEHCAVIGVAVRDDTQLLSDLYEGLSALQHRGQESVGSSFFDHSIHTFKSMGLTSEADIFRNSVKGSLGFGHERYSTTGRSILVNAQPLEMKSKYKITYAFAFNGNIKNFPYLKSKTGYHEVYSDDSDVELLSFLFGRDLGSMTPEQTRARVKIRKELDATTLYYNTISDLVHSIGLNRQELCMGCLTGIYPQIDWSQMDSEW